MTLRRKRVTAPAKANPEKVAALSDTEAERLLASMRGRYIRRYEDKKFTSVEALALQLEFDDGQLAQWRTKIAEIRATSNN